MAWRVCPECKSKVNTADPIDLCRRCTIRVLQVRVAELEDRLVLDAEFLRRKFEWSKTVFGLEQRTEGIVAHIQQELAEVIAEPYDVMEWVDVLLLAFDGAARAGHSPELVISSILAKDAINQAREWPSTFPKADQPSFHIKKE